MPATTDPLVSTEWLSAHLNDPNVKVIDASFKMPGVLPLPKEDYERAHVPGAVFFDVDAVSDHSNSLPHMFPDAEQFGRDVGALGISNADTVALYDSGGWVAAPRAWWMFLSFGHDKVRIVDGAGHFSFMHELPPQMTDPIANRDALLADLTETACRFMTNQRLTNFMTD